jgi:pimeloyl-ACP methyl ester carboxylesterase
MSTVLFIHGAWVTPACWDLFSGFFTKLGYECVAPAWPRKDRPIEELRADPSHLAGLGVQEIVDHYGRLIQALPEPPVLMGHSFGGLFVQMLLDRGYGAAGVAIDSAPPRGVFATELSVFRANLPVLMQPGARRGVVRMTYPQFRYGFANTMSEEAARAAYDQHVTPETGRIFFQAALGASAVRVDFGNHSRKPLLMIAGESDHVVAAGLNRSNFRKYARSKTRTDFKEFQSRCHWLIAQDGWDEVAGYAAAWLDETSAEGGPA